MNFSYLSFINSDSTPIVRKNPEKKLSQNLTIEDCVNFLVDFNKSKPVENETFDEHMEHWLKRKWQVCLDYYLSSTVHGNRIQSPTPYSPKKIDIILPKAKLKEKMNPIEALISRKTHRKFQEQPLQLKTFSQILMELEGELFPDIWKYYLTIFDITDIPPGTYEYYSQEHGLTLMKEGMFRKESVNLLCGMSASLSASFLIVLSLDINKALQSYPYNRALREIYIDSGRMAQKMLIKGMQHGIGGLPSPAMRDTSMCSFFGIHSNECIPLYSLTMGIIPGTVAL